MTPSHSDQTVFLATKDLVNSIGVHALSMVAFLALQAGISWWRGEPAEPVQRGMYVIFLIVGIILYWHARCRRLVVDSQGIRYESGFPSFFQWLGGSRNWSVSAAQLRSRNLRFNPSHAIFSMYSVWIYLDSQPGQRWAINPWRWTTSDRAPLPKLQDRFSTGHDTAALEQTLMQLPVIQHLVETRQYQLQAASRRHDDPPLFQVWKQYGIASLILFGILFLCSVCLPYAVWDEQIIIPAMGWVQLAAVGAFTALLIFIYRHRNIPMAFSLPAAGFLAIFAWFGFEPTLTYLNLVTSRESTQYYTYTLDRIEKHVEFTPQDVGPPPFGLHYNFAYWRRFGVSSQHQFAMRKGGLGLWQIDMTAHHARMKDWQGQ